MESAKEDLGSNSKKTSFYKNKKGLSLLASILIIVLVVSIFFSAPSSYEASTWEKRMPGISGSSVIQTSDGGFLVAGGSATWETHQTPYEFTIDWYNSVGAVTKTDAEGNIQWSKNYSATSGFRYALKTSDGGYMLAGLNPVNASSFYSFQGGLYPAVSQFCLIKIDSQGNMIWNNTYIHFRGESHNLLDQFIQTSDGGYALVGNYAPGHSVGVNRVFFVKVDAHGEQQWSREIANKSWEMSSVFQTSDGGFLLFGTIYNLHAWQQTPLIMVKLDSAGNISWLKTFGGSDDTYYHVGISSVIQVDNAFIVAGYAAPDTTFGGSGYMAGLILKADTDGNILWHKLYEGTIDYPAGKIYSAIASKDGIVAAGSISSGEKTLGRVLKIDLNGNMMWSNIYSYLEYDGINVDYSIFKTSNGYTVFQYLSNRTTDIHNQVKIINIITAGNAQSQTIITNNHFDSRYFTKVSDGFVMLGNNQNEREPGRDVAIEVWLIKIGSS
jgi:hypothetical protein